MSETTEAKIPASLGSVQRMPMNQQQSAPIVDNANNSNDGQATGQSEAEKTKIANDAAAEAAKNKLPELNDDQLKEILKGRGIEFEGDFAGLKTKLTTPAAPAAELTPEEKQKAAADFEKRQLDLFLTSPGATVEGFAAMKNILAAPDLKELSIGEIRASMKGKFDQDQIEAVIQERYYQKNPDELPQGDDETFDEYEARKESFKKLHEYGNEKLTARGQAIKNKAENFFKTLTTAIEKSELSKREVEESDKLLASTTDAFLSKVSKEITYELGDAPDGAKINPVQHKVDDSDIAKVATLLKDKTQRETKFLTAEGELNVEALAEILLENETLKKGLKASYLEGGSRQVEAFRKVFPQNSAYAVGLNGNGQNIRTNPNDKKQVAGVGKSQRVQK